MTDQTTYEMSDNERKSLSINTISNEQAADILVSRGFKKSVAFRILAAIYVMNLNRDMVVESSERTLLRLAEYYTRCWIEGAA